MCVGVLKYGGRANFVRNTTLGSFVKHHTLLLDPSQTASLLRKHDVLTRRAAAPCIRRIPSEGASVCDPKAAPSYNQLSQRQPVPPLVSRPPPLR